MGECSLLLTIMELAEDIVELDMPEDTMVETVPKTEPELPNEPIPAPSP